MLEERQKIADAGMDDYISKPINSQHMFKTMSRYLRQSAPETQSVVRDANGSEQLAALSKIQGLDTKAALERLGEDEDLYLQILAMFVNNQADSAAILQKALHDGDRELAERSAHTCRGVAGSIGATDLQHLAMTLESAIKRHEPVNEINNVFKPFADELDRIVEALRNELSARLDIDSHHEDAYFDSRRATEVLSRLRCYILENDGMAEHYLRERRDELTALPREELQRLRATIADFDYDAALEAVAQLAAKAEITLTACNGEELT